MTEHFWKSFVPISDFAALIVKYNLSQEALAVAHKTHDNAYEQRIKALLEHIENAADVLNEVRRQLPKGSILGSVCFAKEQKLRAALAKEVGI